MIMNMVKKSNNWKVFVEFKLSLDHENGNVYFKEKGQIFLNTDAIAVISKITAKGIDGEDLDFYKLEMVNGNEHFILVDDE